MYYFPCPPLQPNISPQTPGSKMAFTLLFPTSEPSPRMILLPRRLFSTCEFLFKHHLLRAAVSDSVELGLLHKDFAQLSFLIQRFSSPLDDNSTKAAITWVLFTLGDLTGAQKMSVHELAYRTQIPLLAVTPRSLISYPHPQTPAPPGRSLTQQSPHGQGLLWSGPDNHVGPSTMKASCVKSSDGSLPASTVRNSSLVILRPALLSQHSVGPNHVTHICLPTGVNVPEGHALAYTSVHPYTASHGMLGTEQM